MCNVKNIKNVSFFSCSITTKIGAVTGTGDAVYRHWWRSVPALVAQCTGTGGAVCKGATPSVEHTVNLWS